MSIVGRTLSRMFRRHNHITRKPVRRWDRARLAVTNLEDRSVPAVITVTGNADSIGVDGVCSLREAIDSINNGVDTNSDVTANKTGTYGSGDSIGFSAAQTISFNGQIAITNSVIITGLGESSTVLQNVKAAGADSRIFTTTTASTTITLEQMTLKSGNMTTGNSGGAIQGGASGTSLTCNNVTFSGNKTVAAGGAIAIQGAVTLTNCTFSNNSAGGVGGAINLGAATTIGITGTTFTKNTSTGTGGNINVNAASSVTISSSTITANTSTGAGVGINLATGVSTVSLTSVSFSLNSCGSTGGAINAASGSSNSTITIDSCTFSKNTGTTGGVINVATTTSSTYDLKNSSFTDNRATSGGGALYAAVQCVFSIDNCQFTTNTAVGVGGAVRMTSTTPTFNVSNSSFTGNTSTSNGGAIYFAGSSANTYTFTNVTFYKNTAATSGGALHIPGTATYTINNATFSENTAQGATSTTGGGAINISSTANVQINNSTFYNNKATGATAIGGGIRRTSAGTTSMISTILAKNTASTGPDFALQTGATTIAGGANLVGVIDSGGFTLSNTSGPNQTGVATAPLDPLLNAIADNGGAYLPHMLTHLPTPTSKAVANGNQNGLTLDQRGVARLLVGPDIGSTQGTYLIPFGNVTPAVPTVTTAGGTTYAVTVVYTDETGVDTTTINASDITVSGPGYGSPASPNGAPSISGSGTSVTATYNFDAAPSPGGTWDAGDNGTYSINLIANQVYDTDGPNPATAGVIGTFLVAIPSTYTVDSAADVDDSITTAGNLSLREAIRLANASSGAFDTINFGAPLTSTTTLTMALGEYSITDSVVIDASSLGGITINGNQASRIFNINVPSVQGDIQMKNLTLTNAKSASAGGAILLTSDKLTLTNSVVSNNTATGIGGGISVSGNFASGSHIVLTNSKIMNNSASGNGGGLDAGGGGSKVEMDSCTLSGNTAGGNGGAFSESYFQPTGYIRNSTISGNRGVSGGGFSFYKGTPTIENTTIAGNTATANGGGIFLNNTSGTLTLRNVTIAGNSATTNGGGLARTSTGWAVDMTHSIVALNTSSTTLDFYFNAATSVTGDYNLIGAGDVGNATFTGAGIQQGTGASPLDPVLAALGNYGGPTQTRPPLNNLSPVVNAGDTVALFATDQRGSGFPRLVGSNVDLGAVEGELKSPTGTATVANVTVAGASSYTVTVVYTDETGVDTTTLGAGDITVTGPGYGSPASPTGAPTLSGPATSVTATYTFLAPPAGTANFDQADNGTYTVNLLASQVYDLDSPTVNSAFPGSIGSFKVSIPAVYLVDLESDVDDSVTTAGNLTLREAIRLSNAGSGTDIINFDSTKFTGTPIVISSPLSITNGVTINGPGKSLLVLSGNNSKQVFNIGGTSTVAMSGMTVTKGSNAGNAAIGMTTQTLTLSNMDLTFNTSSTTGGAIGMTSASLTISNSKLENNTTGTSGGAIYSSGSSTITITDSIINANTGTTGGAIYLGSGSVFKMDPSILSNNRGTNGSAIYVASTTTTSVELKQTLVSGNTSTSTHGAIYFFTGGTLTVTDSTFVNNSAGTTGGAITFWSGTSMTVTGSSFYNNKGTNGGAIIVVSTAPSVTISNSTIYGNTASAGAGGLTISSTSTTLNLSSTIIAGNSGTTTPDLATPTAYSVSGTDNLIGLGNASWTFAASPNQVGTGTPIDPLLNTPADNGGFTLPDGTKILTMSLKTGSPALGTGNNILSLPYDQRGVGYPRSLAGSTDVGAFQLPPGPVPTAKGNAVNVTSPGGATFDVTVTFGDDVGVNIGTIDVNDVVVKTAFGGTTLNAVSFVTSPGSGVASPVTATYTFNAPDNAVNGTWDASDTDLYSVWLVGTVSDAATPTVNSVVSPAKLASFTALLGAKSLTVSALGDTDDGNYTAGNLTIREAVNFSNQNAGLVETISFDTAVFNGVTTTLSSTLSLADSVEITGPGKSKLALSGNDTMQIFNISGGSTAVTMSSITLTKGRAATGAGMQFTSQTVTLNDMDLLLNTATGSGGGIAMTTGVLTVTGVKLQGNSATTSGAGIYASSTATINVHSSTIDANTASSTGGGIYISNGQLLVDPTLITNNRATSGAAIYAAVSGVVVTIDQSQITGNVGTSSAGAVYMIGTGTLTVSNSTFANNTATTTGGAIRMTTGTGIITNSTFSGNRAVTSGGAIALTSNGTLTINNSTIVGNTGAAGVGGINMVTGTSALTLSSTIVAGNSGTTTPDISTTSGYSVGGTDNLVGLGNASWTFTSLPNQVGAGPSLASGVLPLADNGGFTLPDGTKILTMKVDPSGPAFQLGNNINTLPYDQRGIGFDRSTGGLTDVGAYQFASPVPYAKGVANNVTVSGGTTFDVTVTFKDDLGVDAGTIDINDVVVKSAFGGTTLNAVSFVTSPGSGVATPVTATYTFNAPNNTVAGTWDASDTDIYSVWIVGTVSDDDNPDNNVVSPAKLTSFTALLAAKSMVVDTLGDIDDGNYTSGNLTIREAVNFSNANVNNVDSITFGGPLTSSSTLTLSLGEMAISESVTINATSLGGITISGNGASRIFNIEQTSGQADVQMTKLTITSGKVTGEGGGIRVAEDKLTLTDCVISNNTASSNGGGVAMVGNVANGNEIILTRSVFSGNTANQAGAVAGGAGGSIMQVDSCTFSGNTAVTNGGGFNGSYFPVGSYFRNTTFSNNRAASGGAAAFFKGNPTFENCTLSGNTATANGGAIFLNSSAGTLTLANVTITGNTATTNGGAVARTATGWTVDMKGSIVAANKSATTHDFYFNAAETVTGDYNLIGVADVGNASFSGIGIQSGTSGAPLNPQLAPLSGNGGPTQTHRLLGGSPAINAGDTTSPFTYDQRGSGYLRVQGSNVDLGAYELDPNIPTAAPTLGNISAAGPGPYEFTVTYADDTGIKVSTIKSNTILTVSGPGGFSDTISYKVGSIDVDSDGTPRTASYQFSPPGGAWDALDNGSYTITLANNAVQDTDDTLFVPGGSLGTFNVSIPVTVVVDYLTDENDGDYGPGDLSLREAIGLVNASTATLNSISFKSSLFTGGPQTTTLTLGQMKITQNVVISGPGANLLTIDANSASRIFEVNDATSTVLDVTLSGMHLTKGTSTGTISAVASGGGALYINGESVTLNGMEISNSTAASFGGAICGDSGSKITILNSSLHNNTCRGGDTTQGGGAIYASALGTTPFLTIKNSTLVFNRAGLDVSSSVGGAIIQYSGVPVLTIENSTIYGNTAHQAGGIRTYGTASAIVNITSSILSGNTGLTSQPDVQTGTSPWVVNNSLLGDTTGFTTGTLDAYTTANVGYTVLLGPLQNNGGPTTTMRLLTTNTKGIDEGTNPSSLSYDQRGANYARVVNSGTNQADIGAYEIQAPATVTSVVLSDGTGVAVTHRSMVRQIIVTFSAPVNFTGSVASAFTVHRTGNSALNGNPIGDVALLATPSTGPTSSVTITFDNADTTFVESGGTVAQPLGSLKDGLYNFTIDASKISTPDGALDGDGVGGFGGNYAVVGTTGNGFYRFFGDSNGDGLVNQTDYNAFRLAFLGGPNNIFDFDGGAVGQVSQPDYNAFRLRFLGTP